MLATKLSYITQKETGSTWHVARNSANVFVLPINTDSQEQSADRFFESLTMRMEQQYPGTKFALEKAMSVHVFWHSRIIYSGKTKLAFMETSW